MKSGSSPGLMVFVLICLKKCSIIGVFNSTAFNSILSSGYFPNAWSTGLIVPISEVPLQRLIIIGGLHFCRLWPNFLHL